MLIEVKNLNKTFKKLFTPIHVLNQVDLSVADNQILGVLGPAGAGKTTLLKILAGISTADRDSGSIRICGHTDSFKARECLGFVPTNQVLFPWITVEELLSFSLKVSNTDFSEQLIDNTLQFVGLKRERKILIRNFSADKIRRINIAQALVHSPQLLILDEPLVGMDSFARKIIIDILVKFVDNGGGIVFATQDEEDINDLCSHVVILKRGKIRLYKDLSDLRQQMFYEVRAELDGKIFILKTDNKLELEKLLGDIKKKKMVVLDIKGRISGQLNQYDEQ